MLEAFDCTLVAGVVEWSRHIADLVPVITHCHVEKERSKVIQVIRSCGEGKVKGHFRQT